MCCDHLCGKHRTPLLKFQMQLLQFCVLCLGLLEDWDVGIGVFPEREEVFVSGKGANASGIRIRTLRHSRLQRVRPRHTQLCQRSRPAVPYDAVGIEKLLKNSVAAARPCSTAKYASPRTYTG